MPDISRALLAMVAITVGIGLTVRAEVQDAAKPAPASGRAAESKGTELGFLQVGRSYLIKFPEEHHPVLVRESETVAGSITATDGKTGEVRPMSQQPITWNMKFQIDVFVVRELGAGPWALLEHPADPKAAFQVLSARHVLADAKKVADMEKTEQGRGALARLRKEAERTLETTRTWINLNYATSIADPPNDGPDAWTVKVQATTSTPPNPAPSATQAPLPPP